MAREFCSAAMREAAAVATRIGCDIGPSAEDRHAITARRGAFKTPMLRDAEAGRSIELNALVAAACEIGARAGCPTPNIDILLG
jgi:2-dehydropantoate 2-reductase